MKIPGNVNNGTRNRLSDFGSDPNHCLDQGIFKRIFYYCSHKRLWGCWALAEGMHSLSVVVYSIIFC